MDVAGRALRLCQGRLDGDGLTAGLAVGDMGALPVASNSFEAAIAFNVVYHGLAAQMRQAIDEIHRALRVGGLALVTFLSSRHLSFGHGRPIEPGTYVFDKGADAGVPHHFVADADEVREVMQGFELCEFRLAERPEIDVCHWMVLGEKPG
jgi:SAM-dependent methyltransferase